MNQTQKTIISTFPCQKPCPNIICKSPNHVCEDSSCRLNTQYNTIWLLLLKYSSLFSFISNLPIDFNSSHCQTNDLILLSFIRHALALVLEHQLARWFVGLILECWSFWGEWNRKWYVFMSDKGAEWALLEFVEWKMLK